MTTDDSLVCGGRVVVKSEVEWETSQFLENRPRHIHGANQERGQESERQAWACTSCLTMTGGTINRSEKMKLDQPHHPMAYTSSLSASVARSRARSRGRSAYSPPGKSSSLVAYPLFQNIYGMMIVALHRYEVRGLEIGNAMQANWLCRMKWF